MPTTTKPMVSRAKAYLKVRHKAVRDAMKHLNVDGILLTHPPDLAYLTNFTGDDSIGLFTAKDFQLVTDFRYVEQAEREAGWLKTTLRGSSMSDAVAAVIGSCKVKRIGFEANHATIAQMDQLIKSLKQLGHDVELVPLDSVMVNLRKVKDDTEINLVRKSVAVAEEAFNAVRGEIKVGLSENYLAGLLAFELRCRGASDSSFPVIVAAGANSSLPHYRPDETLVQRDQPLLVDWGALFGGYCSDLTRTLLMGRVPQAIKNIYRIVLEAQQAAISFLRPGVTTAQADTVARQIITQAGFGKQFGHGLGHGIGREIHELPVLRASGAGEELRPGMIVTVEPGIYLPGVGGVRIEDDVLITHSGNEVLSTLDRSFEANHIE